MIRFAVVIPWRDAPDRRPLLNWVLAQWAQHPEVLKVVADYPAEAGPWRKAAAVAEGIRQVPDADAIAVHDADVWCTATIDALRAVADGGHWWAVPHGRVHRLTPDATGDVLAGAQPDEGMPTVQRPYEGVPGGGITVLPASTYRSVPLDPRFQGWGQEDESWGLALERLLGPPWRTRAPLWHLWHEPSERLNRHVGNRVGRALHVRYQLARTPQATRAILDELHALEV